MILPRPESRGPSRRQRHSGPTLVRRSPSIGLRKSTSTSCPGRGLSPKHLTGRPPMRGCQSTREGVTASPLPAGERPGEEVYLPAAHSRGRSRARAPAQPESGGHQPPEWVARPEEKKCDDRRTAAGRRACVLPRLHRSRPRPRSRRAWPARLPLLVARPSNRCLDWSCRRQGPRQATRRSEHRVCPRADRQETACAYASLTLARQTRQQVRLTSVPLPTQSRFDSRLACGGCQIGGRNRAWF